MPTITYTLTDEAAALATYSLLPLVRSIVERFGISVEAKDISLAGRILAAFPEVLTPEQRRCDDLAYLATLVKSPSCCLIKLPNISASRAQLESALDELRSQGYPLPPFPGAHESLTESERSIRKRYLSILGSAVNPQLRDGNSDRRIPGPLKDLMHNPPTHIATQTRTHTLAPWPKPSNSAVTSMSEGDFYHNENSAIIDVESTKLRIEFHPAAGGSKAKTLAETSELHCGDVVDSSYLSKSHLETFLDGARQRCRKENLLYSLHLKATMMKVSDPVIFGIALKHYCSQLWDQHGETLTRAGVTPHTGLGDLLSKVSGHPDKGAISEQIRSIISEGPGVAMVDSDRGISNFHVPSDIIIDASMATMLRDGGRMWDPRGELVDTLAIIPDSSYGPTYGAALEYFQERGSMNPQTMGSLANVGLMAGKAEEYGSHPYTFISTEAGTYHVINLNSGEALLSHDVQEGDIWRMCLCRYEAIKSWFQLAIDRGRISGQSVIFWLDPHRAHDRNILSHIEPMLIEYQKSNQAHEHHQDIVFKSPIEAMKYSLSQLSNGTSLIAATGNVLRDYLTDLFPILEVGTSAKMLSLISLNNGGGLYETGSGGSAPKHVQQFHKENHLRWDSLGEFLALQEALEALARHHPELSLEPLRTAFQKANVRYLRAGKSPSRKSGELDNRGSHFYFILYLIEALSEELNSPDHEGTGHSTDQAFWSSLLNELHAAESQITAELCGGSGTELDKELTGGYYHPDPEKISALMRPSPTLNAIWEKAFGPHRAITSITESHPPSQKR